ncbi:hypothetical protein B296_00023690 [Ensete ventricosum]|uniref:Uncharacterized protein n=1 Tax=Ensete ventricosum TaxID=4639 RepID=A0A427ACA8_ENSVE|nr:hypothetical protein B296_00023690 [Ensete ventricosum]
MFSAREPKSEIVNVGFHGIDSPVKVELVRVGKQGSSSTATSTSKVESRTCQLGGHVIIRGRGIRTAHQSDRCCMRHQCHVARHTSAPTNSPYDLATPEVTTEITEHTGNLPLGEYKTPFWRHQKGLRSPNIKHTIISQKEDVGIPIAEHPSVDIPTVEHPSTDVPTAERPLVNQKLDEVRREFAKSKEEVRKSSKAGSPFVPEIQDELVPPSFRLPTLEHYDGSLDPSEHIAAF